MRALSITLTALVVTALFAARPARAQGPAGALAPPGDDVRPARPAEPSEPDAPGGEDAPGELAVPDPPGEGGYRNDVRYTVPPPEDAAREATEEPSIRIPSRVTTRLRALDANLRSLAARGGGNVVNAVLSLLTGGLAITLGALKEPNDDWMSIYLYVYGGTAATRGVLDLVLTPNASGDAVTYQHMPMTSREEVQARLEYGENALESLAERSLIARVLDASLNMAAGVAVVPIYLAPNDFEIVDPLDYFILIGAGVSVVSGVITLASTSAAEQRWDAYRELRDRLAEEREGEEGDDDLALLPMPESPEPRWRFGGGPTMGGAFAGVGLTF
ncbi:MAG TPA: hypothetical protein RMH99_25560 [Sandaracinaceae bacterium LLY-WYZ-13_1]|nr:hypothetical protein [Sandaracinaceae bacterium LLY-WYZ-13_1]